MGFEKAYFRVLNQFRLAVAKYVWETYRPALRAVFDGPYERMDAVNKALNAYVTSLLDDVQRQLGALLEDWGLRHTPKWIQGVKKAMGVDVSAVARDTDLQGAIQDAREQSWRTLKNYSEDYTKRIEKRALLYATGGESVTKFEAELRKTFKINKNRAKLIARDQISKANASYNRFRQEQAGVERYRWSSSEDERVRPTHSRNNGKAFRWDRPPTETGHPGHDINCRCSAIGIV